MGMTMRILQWPIELGGVGLCDAETYMMHTHSMTYVKLLTRPEVIPLGQMEEFKLWGGQLVSSSQSLKMLIWDREPRVITQEGARGEIWPVLATSAKAYGRLLRRMRGLAVEGKNIRLLPLWNSIVFSNDKGTPYHSPALIRQGVLTVGDIAQGRAADPEKLAVIAPTWRDFYRRRIDWLLAKEEMEMEAILGGSQPPPLDRWRLTAVMKAIALGNGMEDRQPPSIWPKLQGTGLPALTRQHQRQMLWKKMPVLARLMKQGISISDKCPLCGNIEDHEHLLKKCVYLQQPIQLIRTMFRPIQRNGKCLEVSRMLIEEVETSLISEQGIAMWTAVTALWRYRCEVHHRRQNPTQGGICFCGLEI